MKGLQQKCDNRCEGGAGAGVRPVTLETPVSSPRGKTEEAAEQRAEKTGPKISMCRARPNRRVSGSLP